MRCGLAAVSVISVCSLFLGACADDGAPVEDAVDDRFLGSDGKDDRYGIADGSPDALGVLRVVNELDAAALADDVRLTARVAGGIAAHHDGPDGLAATADDDPFDDLAELDAIPYVGRLAFARLVEHARAHGYVDDGATGDAAEVTGACARERAGATSDGEPVTICEELHPTRPFVRLPADQRDGDAVTLHAALVYGGQLHLVDRTGARRIVVDAAGAAARPTDLAGARLPSFRPWYLTYRVTGTLTTWTSPSSGETEPAIHVDTIAPEVLIDGRALDGRMLGAWEGTMTPRTGDLTWDLAGAVPVRFTFHRLVARANVPVFDPSGPTLPDGTAWDIVGRIDNLDAAVRGADGVCLRSLTSRGDANPMFGADTDELVLWRLGGMHAPGDSQLVIRYPENTSLGVGMGDLAPVSAEGVIQTQAPESWTAGSHNSWQFLTSFTRVSAGGEPCTP